MEKFGRLAARLLVLPLLLAVTLVDAFVPSCKLSLFGERHGSTSFSTRRHLKIPFTGGKSEPSEADESKEEKKIGMSGLFQLITAGMGSPFLGDYEGIDKETGNFMFSLEANNLTDEKGQSKQTQMPYFEDGWVDPKDLEKEANKKKKGGGWWGL